MKEVRRNDAECSKISIIPFYLGLLKYGFLIIVVYSLINTFFINYYETFFVKLGSFFVIIIPLFLGLLSLGWFLSLVVVFLINSYLQFRQNIITKNFEFKEGSKLLMPVYILCFTTTIFCLYFKGNGIEYYGSIFVLNLIFLLISLPFSNKNNIYRSNFWLSYRYITMAITILWILFVSGTEINSGTAVGIGMSGMIFMPAYIVGILIALFIAAFMRQK